MNFSQIGYNIAVNGAYAGFNGVATGVALGVSPLPYVAAHVLNGTMAIAGSIALSQMGLRHEPRNWRRFMNVSLATGGSLALTSAILSKIGLVTLTQAPNPLVAAGALILHGLAYNTESEMIGDPKSKNTYIVKPMPAVLLLGASGGALTALALGWDPVVFATIGAVKALLANTDYIIFGCIDRSVGKLAGQLVSRATGILLAVSLLNRNIGGVAASVAFIATSTLATYSQS